MKNTKEKTLKLVEAGILLALIIVVQVVTKSFGQIVTGSLVNLCLAIAALACGPIYSGILAILSPLLAMFIGVGPQYPTLILGIMAGNLVYVLIMSVVLRFIKKKEILLVGVVTSAVAKFLVLFFINVKGFIPQIVGLQTAYRTKLSFMFGLPQLITALIGGIVAYFIVRAIRKMKEKKNSVKEIEDTKEEKIEENKEEGK